MQPNTVSVGSVVCAALAAICLAAAPRSDSRVLEAVLFCAAALFVQLRLLCNLFDGMLAVEFDKSSPLGGIFNDFPDRPADVLILVGCGYSGGPYWFAALGWLAAALALMTAYARVLGVAIGAREYFTGPMAKQHRMAVVTVACVLGAVEALLTLTDRVMGAALIVIIAGCLITIARRLKLVAADLQTAAAQRAVEER